MSLARKLGVTGLIVALAAVSWFAPRGPALTVYGDSLALALLVTASLAMLRNAFTEERARAFWWLLGLGCMLWAISTGFWMCYEVILHREVPEPCAGDVILFIHIAPFMAAVALRPHRPQRDRKVLLDTINFLMLLIWWVFLYAFIVFPDQYVSLNAPVYSRNYDLLYLLENLVLVFVLGMMATSTRGTWRRIYWNLFLASALYTLGSATTDAAINRNQYYTGSVYDVPLLLSASLMIWVAILARRTDLESFPDMEPASRWVDLAPRLAMVAILSLPLLGLWTLYADTGPPLLRNFRLLVTMAATLVLGLFVFLKQFLLDRQLINLLDESRRSYENLQRLQTHLVQKEKLASLGQLVAGAAHEINNPLAAILGYSELLASQTSLKGEQASMAQRIGQQARRTRDLVADLLSFSQQSPSEKVLVDVTAVVQRALQMHEVQVRGKNIRVEANLDLGLPRIWGNTNQLLQTFLHLTENAIDALNEVGGGSLLVSAKSENNEVVVQFSDSGPGMTDPQRVFDPFYTTKPIGKGTGLGLSATYGVVQDHQGQITCHNKPEGGALFVVRFPVASQAAAAVEAGQA
ncbi:MAG TPA: HAMP domain-containing sensor histidine kinase [Terriglobales bacterium]|nr:HAMP domain-containing sensor histidine kinase [Terriglobales bacterium]